jgi:TetR/AcrR family transcriptional regulator, regulator of cefoperazone and chloramphenicol sensitivity
MAEGGEETKLRLLKAAGEVFAEVGFHCASVRQICERAQANVAAINYHFGDKQNLYRETLRYSYEECLRKFPISTPEAEPLSPEKKLHFFIQQFIRRILDDGTPAWHGRLFAREMLEPTPILDEVVHQAIKPQHDELHRIVRSLVGKRVSDKEVHLIGSSIIGQCVSYHHGRPVLERLCPSLRFDEAFREKLVEHIFRFSLGAIRSYHAMEKA